MPEKGAEPDGLGRRSVTAMLWGTGGGLVRIAMQVAAQIVLARLLGPELYGVFAVALVAVLLSALLADVGLAYGLIQKRSVSDADVRFVFTWQVILGLAMTLGLWLAAPYIAALYGDPRVAPVVAMLAATCLVNSAAAASGSLLRREMDFKTLNIAAVISYAAGFLLVAIPLALLEAGVAALAAGFMVQATVMAALQYAKVRHPVRPLLWQAESPAILGFGATVLATNLVNWAMSSIDRAIVGTSLGLTAAGLYATAYNLIQTPMQTALALLQSVFYAASSKVQDDHAQLARGLVTLLAALGLFVMPVLAGVAAAAETIIVALYGARWTGGGAVLAPLALAMVGYLAMGLATPVLWASGETRKEFLLQLPIALFWVVALGAIALAGSLTLLAWTVCGLFWLRAAVILQATLKAIALPWARVVAAVMPGAIVTLIVAAAGLATDRLLGGVLGHGLVLLLADVTACALALLAGLRLVRSRIAGDVLRLLDDVAGRLPGSSGRRALVLILGRVAP